MANTIDFLPFANGVNANVEAQAAWVQDIVVTDGFSTGTAQSAQVNKAIRQGSVMAAAFANWLAGALGQDVLDNGDFAGLVGQLRAALAPLVSPVFTGTPTAPTPAPGTSSNQLATMAALAQAIAQGAWAPIHSPAFTGIPTVPTPPVGDNSGGIPNTAWVNALLAGYAPLASPAFGGTPTAPTPALGTDTNQIATMGALQTALQNLNINQGLGFGQAWAIQSRSVGVTYTNTTGNTIAVSIYVHWFSGSGTFSVSIGSAANIQRASCSSSVQASGLFFVVPPGGSYTVTQDGSVGGSLVWGELR